jgi:hypothetical protein
VELPGGHGVRVVALHPEPPLPNRDTLGRDAEILVAAKIARDESLPVIVTGDLNDVAWSRTTRRFLRISGLLDPRQGRGMFNSFDARYWFLRWPLDHIFHSRDFELISIERQAFVGSDHFPMFYRLALTARDRNDPPPPPSGDDVAEAEEAIKVEKNRDRPLREQTGKRLDPVGRLPPSDSCPVCQLHCLTAAMAVPRCRHSPCSSGARFRPGPRTGSVDSPQMPPRQRYLISR